MNGEMGGQGEHVQKKNEFLDDMRRRQRNVLWEDTVRNGRKVDKFLWSGAPDAPLVQRLGAFIFGMTFIGFSLLLVEISWHEKSLMLSLISCASFGVGIKVFRNGFRRKPE